MAVLISAVATGTVAGASSLTFPITIPANDTERFLIVEVSIDNRTVSGVTFAGQALTSVGSAQNGAQIVHKWKLVNPPAGTNNVVVTLSGGGTDIVAHAICFKGVDQVTPHGTVATATGTSTTPSVVVASAVGELVVDGISSNLGTLTVGAGQTERGNAQGGDNFGGASTEDGATSVTMSWTIGSSSAWAMVGVSIKPFLYEAYVTKPEQFDTSHNTKIATGSNTTGDVYLDALIAATSKNDKLTLKVERELIATAFDNVANSTQAIELVYDPDSPRIRRSHTTVYDPTRKRLLVFGGWNGTTQYNDVWELTLDDVASPVPQWRKLAPTGTAPSARRTHIAFFDNTLNRMIVGFGFDTAEKNDMYSLSFSGSRDGAWTTLSPSGTIPTVRGQTSICTDQTNKKAYLVAGWGTTSRFNDIQEFDFSTTNGTWTQKSADGAAGAMSRRNDPACVWDATNSRIVMFGGNDGTNRLNDTWTYVPSTNTWTNKTSVFAGTAPSIRELMFCGLDTTNNRMVIFGGRAGTTAALVRTDYAYLTLTAGSETWNVITPVAGETPYGAWTNAGCYDPLHKLFICFGGMDSSLENQSNLLAIDCSVSNTLKMGQIVLNQYMRGRDAMGYAYNSDRDETLVAGGFARVYPEETATYDGGHTNDLWLFKHATSEWIPAIRGKTWIPFTNREGVTVIYDTSRARFIIFGGLAGNGTSAPVFFNDVWELKADANGVYTLTKLNPTGTKPSARWLHAAVYDATNNRMVVFGGDAGGAYLNDLYSLSFSGGADGAWSTITPTGTPPAGRRQTAYAIDTGANEMLISHGGLTASTFASNTFKLTLTAGSEAWSTITPTGAPTARRGMTAIYRATDDAFYFFGGYDGTLHYNGTYKLTFGATPVWSTLSPTGTIPETRRSHAAGYSPVSGKMLITHGREATAASFETRANSYEYNVVGNSWALLAPKVYIQGSTKVTGLANGSYHWQSWVTGTLGGDSTKLSYGGNAETVADFIIGAGVVIVDGAASSSATASQSGAGIMIALGSASPSATASQTGDAIIVKEASATPSATASASATAVIVIDGASSSSATASQTGAGVLLKEGASAPSATASSSADGLIIKEGASAPSATASSSATGLMIALGGSSQTATGSQSGAGVIVIDAVATNTATASSSATGSLLVSGASSQTATGSQSGAGDVIKEGASSTSATASSSATGILLKEGASTNTATASQTGSAIVIFLASASVSATASQSGAGVIVVDAGSSVTATASQTGAGDIIKEASASPSATASQSGAGIMIALGSASSPATASQTGVAVVVIDGASSPSATASSSATAVIIKEASASSPATASQSGAGTLVLEAIASPTATASSVSGGLVVKEASASTTATGSQTAGGLVIVSGASSVSATSSSSGTAVLVKEASATNSATASQSGAGLLVVEATATATATASASATGGIFIDGASTSSATASQSATGSLLVSGGASVSSTASQNATAVLLKEGASSVSATASQTATGGLLVSGASSSSATASQSGAGILLKEGASNSSSTASSSATAVLLKEGVSSQTATASQTGGAVIIFFASASPSAVASQSAAGLAVLFGQSSQSGTASAVATGGIVILGQGSASGTGSQSGAGQVTPPIINGSATYIISPIQTGVLSKKIDYGYGHFLETTRAIRRIR